MPIIANRTVYYDQRASGAICFWDWAVVTTTGHGTMFEPFQPGVHHGPDCAVMDWDPDDDLARIDRLEQRDIGTQQVAFCNLHGGALMPRIGR